MEIVLNMVVALCVGLSYVAGYILAILSLILLISWIIDGRYNTNFSRTVFAFLKLYLPEKTGKSEKVFCKKCDDVKTAGIDTIDDNYCSLCGKKFKKNKTSAHDIQVEKMTNKIVLFAIAAIVCYTISASLFVVFAILSIGSGFFYCLTTPKIQQMFSR